MALNAVILFSGGLDSTTAMWKIRDEYKHLYTLTFKYGARDQDVMLSVCRRLSKLAGTKHSVIDLPWLKQFSRYLGSALIKGEIPAPSYKELDDPVKASESAEKVWIPARNLVFISIAAAFAETLEGGADIVAGFDLEEAATFPDNSHEFVKRMNSVLELGVSRENICVKAPLIHLNKSAIAALALKLKVPVEYTLSCYAPPGLNKQDRPIHCGRCESCMRRKRGFNEVRADKTVYLS